MLFGRKKNLNQPTENSIDEFKLFYLIPDTIYHDPAFRNFFISISELMSEFRYDRDDIQLNCARLPVTPRGALTLGVAMYSDHHPSYDEFVRLRLHELIKKGDQLRLAALEELTQEMGHTEAQVQSGERCLQYYASSIRGFLNFLRFALQAGGIKEANNPHVPLLLLSDNDPHLAINR